MSWDSEDEMGPAPSSPNVEERVLECFERSSEEWLRADNLMRWSGSDLDVLMDLVEMSKLEVATPDGPGYTYFRLAPPATVETPDLGLGSCRPSLLPEGYRVDGPTAEGWFLKKTRVELECVLTIARAWRDMSDGKLRVLAGQTVVPADAMLCLIYAATTGKRPEEWSSLDLVEALAAQRPARVDEQQLYEQVFKSHNLLAGFSLEQMKGRGYRHKVTKGLYYVSEVVLREDDHEPLVVYWNWQYRERSHRHRIYWARPLGEFLDRFTLASSS